MFFALLATGAVAVTPPEDCTTVNHYDCTHMYNPFCEWDTTVRPKACKTRTQYGCYEYTEAEQQMIDDNVKTEEEVCLEGAHEGFKYEGGSSDTHIYCGDCHCCAPANCEGAAKRHCSDDPQCAYDIVENACHPATKLGCENKNKRDCLKNKKCALTWDKICINKKDMTCALKHRSMKACRKDRKCMVLGEKGSHTCKEKDCHLYNQKGCTHDPDHTCAWDSVDTECLDLDEIECSHIKNKAGCENVAKHDGHCYYSKKGKKCMKPCDYNHGDDECQKGCCNKRDPTECQWLMSTGECTTVPGFNCHDLDDNKRDCNSMIHCKYNKDYHHGEGGCLSVNHV